MTPYGNYSQPQGGYSGGMPMVSQMSSWGQLPPPETQLGTGMFGIAPPIPTETPAAAVPAGLFGSGDIFDGIMGSKSIDPTTGEMVETPGWGMPALGVANGLLSAFMGMKQYGIAKDSLAEGKRQFQLNYDAQRQTTNSALEDRQRARVASNPGAYQSVGDYMSANGIRG